MALSFSFTHWHSALFGAISAIVVTDVIALLFEIAKNSNTSLRHGSITRFLTKVVTTTIREAIKLARKSKRHSNEQAGAFWDLVGNTPLIRIASLSEELGIEVFGKAEFLNPGGSVKDRVAREIIRHAENQKLISKGDYIFEGTSGSTGISLTLAANCRGYKCSIYMPDDQANEKVESLRVLGAEVTRLRPCSITDPEHYVNAARLCAEELEKKSGGQKRGYFANQFENLANFKAHYEGTAVEILQQSGGKIDFFVASSGTGGTIAGSAVRLKEHNPKIGVILADPPGSALYNRKDAEGHRTRRIFDTIIEGVGINRLTQNFMKGERYIDYAYTVSDLEAVHMSRYLISKDGLFLGSSSALNCCAIVKAVKDGKINPGSTVIVILCDSGVRHLSRFYNSTYLSSYGLLPRYISPAAQPIDIHTLSSQAALSFDPPKSVFQFVD